MIHSYESAIHTQCVGARASVKSVEDMVRFIETLNKHTQLQIMKTVAAYLVEGKV